MKKVLGIIGALLLGIAIGWFSANFSQDVDEPLDFAQKIPAIEKDIRDTLARQDATWNRGDIDGFMQDYMKSEGLRFASGGKVNRGWQATIDGYKTRYPDKAAMGTLSFTDLEIEVFSEKDALVFGRWSLERKADRPNGLFTLNMQNQDGRWVIVSDHTSSAD